MPSSFFLSQPAKQLREMFENKDRIIATSILFTCLALILIIAFLMDNSVRRTIELVDALELCCGQLGKTLILILAVIIEKLAYTWSA